jgi:trk system potassium uptake protein TrkH
LVAKQATELRYAVLFRVVFKYFGQLSLVLATLALVPLVMSVIFADTAISLLYGIVTGGLAAFGASLVRLRAPSRVQANEGMVLVALMLLFAPLVMSYPLMGSGFGFLDTFFEAGAGGAGGFGLKEEQVVGSEIQS